MWVLNRQNRELTGNRRSMITRLQLGEAQTPESLNQQIGSVFLRSGVQSHIPRVQGGRMPSLCQDSQVSSVFVPPHSKSPPKSLHAIWCSKSHFHRKVYVLSSMGNNFSNDPYSRYLIVIFASRASWRDIIPSLSIISCCPEANGQKISAISAETLVFASWNSDAQESSGNVQIPWTGPYLVCFVRVRACFLKLCEQWFVVTK